VRLWGGDGRPGPVLQGHTGTVASVSWSPDGRRLVTGSWNKAVQLWDSDGKAGAVLQGHTGQVLSVSWSPDGQGLASAGGDQAVRLWGGDGRPGPVLQGRAGSVASVSWSPDGRRLVTGSWIKAVQLWDSDGKAGPVLQGHTGPVLSVCWSPDGRRLASGGGDDTVRLWGADGQAGAVFKEHRGTVKSVSWGRAGDRVASAGEDGTIFVHDANSLDALWSAVVLRSGRSAVFGPAGQMLFGHPAAAERDFVYVAETDAGRFELFTPGEFQKRARRDGKPLSLFGPGATPPGRPADEAWAGSVQPLPPAKQRDEVFARLEELNPGLLGPVEPRKANGPIVSVTLPPSPALVDLSPLRALTGLEHLTCSGNDDPLRLPLSDLTPLAGLKLRELRCDWTEVADLTPLRGMPLVTLSLEGTRVSDLRPLGGAGMPLQELSLRSTPVSDLSPLQGLPLESLDVTGTRVTDLSPLRQMALQSLECDFVPERDAAVLRALPTLAQINGQPAAEFWKKAAAPPERKP
jgi:dipeptidyl aminopeptidase/acylaminoacyl peptidase